MKKRLLSLYLVFMMLVAFTACGNAHSSKEAEGTKTEETTETASLDLKDGTYTVDFTTDSTMFHINDAYDGKATLTVEDGQGTVHIVLASARIVNLYLGTAEDAQKEGAELIEPTEESVTYSDGLTEDVHAFDVPVPVIDKEFDLALVGTKGTWYDHKVRVSNPVASEGATMTAGNDTSSFAEGDYTVEVALEGGSGRSTITSPAPVKVGADGTYTVTIEWSSPYYDYMIVDGVKYKPVNTEGNSVFEIPFSDISAPVTVTADTVAMSTPHEIEYSLTFDLSTMQ
ncbi:MAG: iron transporter [Lachnospiraceae bacterium]|nr:iron transporter [Lachnospiraceae bacterium]